MPDSTSSKSSELDANLIGAGPVHPEPIKPTGQRIDSIDLLRGIVMVIMMLDHTRDFVHKTGLFADPTDLTTTTTALFLTRWITHFCAPAFVFLAGVGAYLQFARGKSKSELARFLITRGLWLIVLELTLVRLGAFFSFDYRFFGVLQVIWAIGVSMIVLAGLIYLSARDRIVPRWPPPAEVPSATTWSLVIVAVFGVAMIGFHNLLDRFQVVQWQGPQSPVPGFGAKLWMILHQQGGFPILWFFPSPIVAVIYPLIPWIGVMAAGYAFGALFQMDARLRRRLLLVIGGITTAAFIAMRFANFYGDPSTWSRQKNAIFTVLSFVNTTKYPPSLLFLLMTLGPSIAALAWFEVLNRGAISRFFVTFGRVPLFFYLLQWPTAHLISVLLHWAFGKPVAWLFKSPIGIFENPPKGNGFDLWVVYLCWFAGIALLYPLCKWFAGVKARRRDWWLSYL